MAQKQSNLPIGYTPPKRGERIKASDIQGIAKAVKRLTRRGRENYQTAFPTPGRFPFEIYVNTEVVGAAVKPTINARDGVFDMTEFVDIKEIEPADGVWYLQAKAVIDLDTGAITERLVEFVDETGVSDASTFYSTIGSIEVIDGVPDASTIIQSNYGPLFTLRYGGIDEKWAVIIY